jgi:hypothetical protein
MNAAALGVCAPNIVERHVQRLRVCIAKDARGALRVPGSVTYSCWPLYCSSRVMGNCAPWYALIKLPTQLVGVQGKRLRGERLT